MCVYARVHIRRNVANTHASEDKVGLAADWGGVTPYAASGLGSWDVSVKDPMNLILFKLPY